MSSDDRQLRDELEKVQAEVVRLRRAIDRPEGLHTDLRARIESLRRSRVQQQEKLDEVRAEVDRLEAELRAVMDANAVLQSDLDGLLVSERSLVGTTVHTLDPGPPATTGCLGVLVFAAAAVALGACW